MVITRLQSEVHARQLVGMQEGINKKISVLLVKIFLYGAYFIFLILLNFLFCMHSNINTAIHVDVCVYAYN